MAFLMISGEDGEGREAAREKGRGGEGEGDVRCEGGEES